MPGSLVTEGRKYYSQNQPLQAEGGEHDQCGQLDYDNLAIRVSHARNRRRIASHAPSCGPPTWYSGPFSRPNTGSRSDSKLGGLLLVQQPRIE